MCYISNQSTAKNGFVFGPEISFENKFEKEQAKSGDNGFYDQVKIRVINIPAIITYLIVPYTCHEVAPKQTIDYQNYIEANEGGAYKAGRLLGVSPPYFSTIGTLFFS
jgi:hypothetical protein